MSLSVDNGFYTVGERVFANKVEAILESQKVHKPVDFNFHDDFYGRLNWSIEPESTLEELYAVRAWELRNRYDYLVLHFSGGSDSINILETFIKNKIPLDELLLRGPVGGSERNEKNVSPENLYAEMLFQAWPLAEWAKNTHYPDLVITGVDTVDYVFDYFKNPNWFETHTNPIFACGVVSRTDYDHLSPHYKSLSEKGKKVGHILGIEKPMVHTENDQFYVRFLDKYSNTHIAPRLTHSELPYFVESFYWADSTGPLVCKQAHAIKQASKKNNMSLNEIKKTRSRNFHNWIASVIYNRTLPIRWQAEKSTFGKYEFDSYFFKDSTSEHVINYHKGIEYFNQLIPEMWKHQDTDILEIVGVWSKSYCIGS